MKKLFIKPVFTLFLALSILVTPSIVFSQDIVKTSHSTHYIDRQY